MREALIQCRSELLVLNGGGSCDMEHAEKHSAGLRMANAALSPSPAAGCGVREALATLIDGGLSRSENRGLANYISDQFAALDRQTGEREGVLADIAAERRRQVEAEGWTPAHDDEHVKGEMATAAACYAYVSPLSEHDRRRIANEGAPYRWPWEASWWKPTDARRDLIKAGALIVAEIERMDRASLPAAPRDADRAAGQGEVA